MTVLTDRHSGCHIGLGVLLLMFAVGCSEKTVDPPAEGPPAVPFKIDVAGYLPDYRVSSVPETVSPMMSHLIYFSIEPLSDGNLDLSRFGMTSRGRLGALQTANPELKMIIAVGGWGRSAYFPVVTRDDALRTKFVRELLLFCRTYRFDGIDLDWEFPANSSEQSAYARLIVQLGDSCSAQDRSLSAALNVYQSLAPEAYSRLDRIHIMSYDHSGRHSTYEQALADVGVFQGRGIAAAKLYLGIPFYGRKISDFSQSLSYRDIVDRYHPLPDIDEADGYYFNNIRTVEDKTAFARRSGLGGVMIWEIGQDTEDETSLLKALYQTATADSL